MKFEECRAGQLITTAAGFVYEIIGINERQNPPTIDIMSTGVHLDEGGNDTGVAKRHKGKKYLHHLPYGFSAYLGAVHIVGEI